MTDSQYKKQFKEWFKTLLLDEKYHSMSLKIAKNRIAYAKKVLKKMK